MGNRTSEKTAALQNTAVRTAQTDGPGAAARSPEGAMPEEASAWQEMPLSGQPERKAQRAVKPNTEFCPVLAELPVYLL